MNMNGKKNDKGKDRPTLLPIIALRCAIKVLEFGARKYSRDNWKRVSPDRYKDAMMRHIFDYLEDESSVDEESGLPHLYHALTNCMFLCYFHNNKENEQVEDDGDSDDKELKNRVICDMIRIDSNSMVCSRCKRVTTAGFYKCCPNCEATVRGENN